VRIVNRAEISVVLVEEIVSRAGIAEEPVVIFLDNRKNQERHAAAAKRIAENLAKKWKPNAWDLKTVAQDQDHQCPVLSV